MMRADRNRDWTDHTGVGIEPALNAVLTNAAVASYTRSPNVLADHYDLSADAVTAFVTTGSGDVDTLPDHPTTSEWSYVFHGPPSIDEQFETTDVFRTMVFDWEQLWGEDRSWGGAAFEIATVLPFTKAGKLTKLGKAVDHADDALRYRTATSASTIPVTPGAAPVVPIPTGPRGPVSDHPFDPIQAGGPIRNLDASQARINAWGTDLVEQHLNRFAEPAGLGVAESQMLARLRQISAGDVRPTIFDQRFYSHELRESVRYRKLGFRSGQPADDIAAHDLWNNAHTATLEDYGIADRELWFPGVQP